MFHLIADVLLTILAPILLMVLIGALLRWKLRIDVGTLGKLNIYLFVPVYVFEYVANSKLKWQEMAGIFGITVLQVLTLGILIWGIGRMLRIPRNTLAAMGPCLPMPGVWASNCRRKRPSKHPRLTSSLPTF